MSRDRAEIDTYRVGKSSASATVHDPRPGAGGIPYDDRSDGTPQPRIRRDLGLGGCL
jgi:hypothetical protein